MLKLSDQLEAEGVGIASITESIDTTTAAGELFRTILAGVAEFEKAIITERLVARKRAKRAKLGPTAYIGGPTVPFGYRVAGDQLEPDPATWPIVKRIKKERLAGETLRAIAARLNADGITGARGGRWTAGTISRMLRSVERLG